MRLHLSVSVRVFSDAFDEAIEPADARDWNLSAEQVRRPAVDAMVSVVVVNHDILNGSRATAASGIRIGKFNITDLDQS